MRVAAGVQEGVLPGPGAAAVATAAVGEDQQAGGARVADAAFGAPPGFDAIDGELGVSAESPTHTWPRLACRS